MFELESLEVNPEWEQSLSDLGMLDIEALSTREFEWVEKPNHRMGGWSGVSRFTMQDENGVTVLFYLKIQVNHCYRTIGNLMRKRLTYEREMDAFKGIQASGLLPELVLFAKWRNGRDVGSIFITRELHGYVEIEEYMEQVLKTSAEPDAEIQRSLAAVAGGMRQLHATGWAHFAAKPKHVFIRECEDSNYSIRFLDFERGRRPFRKKIFVTEDVSRFLRQCVPLTREQKMQFLRDYFQVDSFDSVQLQWIKEMEKASSLNDNFVRGSHGERRKKEALKGFIVNGDHATSVV